MRDSMAEHQNSVQYKICMLIDRLIDVLPYNYDDPRWRKLLEKPPTMKEILNDDDVEAYKWDEQEILLESYHSEEIKRLNLFEKTFIVYLGEKPLLGGSFIEQGSARAINYPVIYVDKSQSQVVFHIRPNHTMFIRYSELTIERKGRIELKEIRQHFETLGKLR
jgi:hypothetical protein